MCRYAYNDAAQLCDNQYLSHPDLKIMALDTTTKSDIVKCVYVPSHLHHIFFEIFKVNIFFWVVGSCSYFIIRLTPTDFALILCLELSLVKLSFGYSALLQNE